MQLVTAHDGFQYVCVEHGADDSVIGLGATPDAARRDFMVQWIERQADRDIQNAVAFAKSWDAMMAKLCGVKP